MTKYNLHKIFPIPILTFKFDNHKNYFFDDIEYKKNVPQNWICDINSTYPEISDSDTFIDKNKKENLKNDLLEEIKKMFLDGNIPNNIAFKDNFWYNIYHDNQYQERHNHLMLHDTTPLWSGVYYNKNPSPITFHQTSSIYKTNKFKDYENSILRDSYYDMFDLTPEEGTVIIFPPYLDHEVLSNKNLNKNKMRLTFAFNIFLE